MDDLFRTAPGAFPAAIRAQGLVKRYRDRSALDGAEVTVPEGAVYVLVGPNGAGKTTLMRILLDLVRPEEGCAEVLGLDAVRDGAEVRASCGWLPERGDAGYPWMTVGELLEHHAAYRPGWDAGYADALLDRLEVRDHARFGKLSKGEARRIQLVTALAHRPPLLLLDEPTDGLDPLMRDAALELLSDHVAEHADTVLISTHLVSEVEGLGDHLGVLMDGRVRVELDREAMRACLLRYVFARPSEWAGLHDLDEARIVARRERGREAAWTVWGPRDEVVARLTASGATVRDVRPLTLEQAAVAFLSHLSDRDRSRPRGGADRRVSSTAGRA